MDTDLTAIRQRAEAALIGPWENDELLEISGPGAVAIAQVHGPDDFPCLDEDADIDALQQEAEDTAAFIAHARADIPNLLDRIEALERALVTARTALEAAIRYFNMEIVLDGAAWRESRQEARQALTEIAGVGVIGAKTAAVQP